MEPVVSGAYLKALLADPWPIERVFGVECALFAGLLVVLWLNRAVRAAWRRRRAAGVASVRMGIVTERPEALAVSNSVGASEGYGPAVNPAPEPAPPPSPVSGSIDTRPRVRPRRETEDSVLSPETLLQRAEAMIAAGDYEDAASQLRLCVRLAAKLKLPAVEARARLDLGDLANRNGDSTTACEHWQMARALFTDQRQPVEAAAAEKRMENAGCPTDWVLNQF